MPTYEFLCLRCNNTEQRKSDFGVDGSELTCPSCQYKGLVRTLSDFSTSFGIVNGSKCGPCSGGSCSSCK